VKHIKVEASQTYVGIRAMEFLLDVYLAFGLCIIDKDKSVTKKGRVYDKYA
jgi:hypothetical protein